MNLICFIQARISSKRFPGKVLVKIKNKEILKIIYQRINKNIKPIKVVILTSNLKSDKKIINFCKKNNYSFSLGPLNNVFERYKLALKKNKVDGFIRITGDSPLINIKLLKKMIKIFKRSSYDIVTNVFPRTYPIGQSIEIVGKEVFLKVNARKLDSCSKEHITQHFYKNSDKYKIFNVLNKINLSKSNLSINTREDLQKISRKIYAQI
jgi:spore coat polysaccharide biosynthesis protein SpsF